MFSLGIPVHYVAITLVVTKDSFEVKTPKLCIRLLVGLKIKKIHIVSLLWHIGGYFDFEHTLLVQVYIRIQIENCYPTNSCWHDSNFIRKVYIYLSKKDMKLPLVTPPCPCIIFYRNEIDSVIMAVAEAQRVVLYF